MLNLDLHQSKIKYALLALAIMLAVTVLAVVFRADRQAENNPAEPVLPAEAEKEREATTIEEQLSELDRLRGAEEPEKPLAEQVADLDKLSGKTKKSQTDQTDKEIQDQLRLLDSLRK